MPEYKTEGRFTTCPECGKGDEAHISQEQGGFLERIVSFACGHCHCEWEARFSAHCYEINIRNKTVWKKPPENEDGYDEQEICPICDTDKDVTFGKNTGGYDAECNEYSCGRCDSEWTWSWNCVNYTLTIDVEGDIPPERY